MGWVGKDWVGMEGQTSACSPGRENDRPTCLCLCLQDVLLSPKLLAWVGFQLTGFSGPVTLIRFLLLFYNNFESTSGRYVRLVGVDVYYITLVSI